MPSEERYIEFKDAETVAAVQRYVRTRHEGRASAVMRHVEPVTEGATITGAQALGDQGIEQVQIDLSLPELTAALLSWCFASKVPVPRQASKQVIFKRDRFTLILLTPPTSNSHADEAPADGADGQAGS